MIFKEKFTFVLLSFIISITSFSCQSNKKNISTIKKYQSKGDSLTIVAQQVLLKNLSTAIAENGLPYAIEYCNVNAMKLTQSVSDSISIQRLSNKNRNSNNELSLPHDKAVFDFFKKINEKGLPIKDTVLLHQQKYIYYKPIQIGISTCLHCHGNPKEDISDEVLSVINEKYPNDKAQGYKIGDLRGMWKVQF